MSEKYQALPAVTLSEDNTYTHPEAMPEVIHLDDPALDIITNFEKVKPAITHPNDSIDDTLVKMKSSGRLVMLVVKDQQVVGAVSSGDLQGEKPLKIIQDDRITRKEIKVSSVMTHRKKLLAIDYQELRFAKIGHLIKTLREHAQRYALVVDIDENTQEQTVHGLVNAYDIVKHLDKKLGVALNEARSIIELQKTLD